MLSPTRTSLPARSERQASKVEDHFHSKVVNADGDGLALVEAEAAEAEARWRQIGQ